MQITTHPPSPRLRRTGRGTEAPGRFFLVVFLVSAAALGCRAEQPAQPPVQTTTPAQTQSAADPETQKLQRMTARFAPVDLTVDVTALPPNERQALAKMVEASRVFDAL